MTVYPEQLESEWSLAVADAGLDPEECRLALVDRPETGEDIFFLEPGSFVRWTPEYPLTDRQLQQLNEMRDLRPYRVLLTDVRSRTARLALMRHALETARQYEASPEMYHLGVWISDALLHVYGGRGPGSASTMRHHPMWADAMAAGAAFARRHAREEPDEDLLWGLHGALLRTTWQAEAPSSLPKRMLVWAALHADAVDKEAESEGGFGALLSKTQPGLVGDWEVLVMDRRLALLARAARHSIPSPERIAGSSRYYAAVWDRTLDLLARGMRFGRELIDG